MSRKLIGTLFALALAMLGGGGAAQATVVYTFTTAGVSFDDPGAVSLGFSFTANNTVNVTSLGYFDSGGDGFLTPHDVAIFAGNGLGGPPGLPLVTTTLAAGTSGTLGPNDFRYQAITPFTLIAGQQYTIAGFRPSDGTIFDPYLFGGPSNTTGFSVVPQITIPVNAALFTYGNSFVEPSSHFSDFQFYGVNFDVVSVPEPSTLGLIGLGLLGLGAMKRRRRQPLTLPRSRQREIGKPNLAREAES